MKKLTAGFCAIALAAVPTAQAMAAPSIGTSGPKDPVVSGDHLSLRILRSLLSKKLPQICMEILRLLMLLLISMMMRK